MDLKSFEHIVKTEDTARRFLIKLYWKNYRRFCMRCNSYEIYRLANKNFDVNNVDILFMTLTGDGSTKSRLAPGGLALDH